MKRLSQTILIMMAFLLLLISAGCHQKQTYAVYSPGDTITYESGNVVATVLNEERRTELFNSDGRPLDAGKNL